MKVAGRGWKGYRMCVYDGELGTEEVIEDVGWRREGLEWLTRGGRG